MGGRGAILDGSSFGHKTAAQIAADEAIKDKYMREERRRKNGIIRRQNKIDRKSAAFYNKYKSNMTANVQKLYDKIKSGLS